jgi:hypothetical protein
VTVDPVTGAITYEPDEDFNGQDTFSYEICDSEGGCDTAVVTVDVLPVDDPLVAQDDAGITDEDTPVTIAVTDNDIDVDGEIDLTTVTVLTPPAHGTVVIDPVTGDATYLPDPNFNGQDTFTYQVCNTEGLCDVARVDVTVIPRNDPPIAACLETVVIDGTVIRIELRGSDPDGDPVTYRIVQGPSQGMVGGFDESDGSFYYSSRACGENDVSIYVGEDAQPGVVNALPGESVAIQTAGGAPALATIISPPSGGTAEVDDLAGIITYLPSEGFVGSDELMYWACPQDQESFAGLVTIVYEVADLSGATAECVVQLTVVTAAGGGAAGQCERRVVISEVAWSGTKVDPKHEWIELRNMETEPVDLDGWTLRWRRKRPEAGADALSKAIPLSGVVAPYQPDTGVAFRPDEDQPGAWWVFWEPEWRDDFFLIERETDEAVLHVSADLIYDEELSLDRVAHLDDRGDVIELVDPTGCVVDTANADELERDGWVAGMLWPPATMERTDPTESDLDANWHTNLGLVRSELDVWGDFVHGTPKRENSPILSEAVTSQGLTATVHVIGDLVELRFDALPEWPADDALWRVLVLRSPSDEVVDTDWALGVTDNGDIAIRILVDGLTHGEIHVWVRTPSGDLLVAPISISP